MTDFVYDLPRILRLRALERDLARQSDARLQPLAPLPARPAAVGVLSGSFNPLTHGHEALATAAQREGLDAVLLLLPLRAVDKEGVTRASALDRALVLTAWAERHPGVGVSMVNRGLYVEHAHLLAASYPASRVVFLVGHDKIVQIFDPRYYADRDAALRDLFGYSTLRVAPRQDQGHAALRALLDRAENHAYAPGVAGLAVDSDVAALSSTVVREAARAGTPWEDLVPPEAVRFIHEARPYAPPVRGNDGAEIDAYGLRLALIEAIADGRAGFPPDPSPDIFATLYDAACSDTSEGRRLRARLATNSSS